MNLTAHFTLEELTQSGYAERMGIDNTPDEVVQGRLVYLAGKLELARAILGAPLLVSSGYRCQALNRAVGSKDTSAHMQGLAADFICPGFGSPLVVAQRLASRKAELGFDQLIHEFRRWVHIGFRLDSPRGELLTIDANGVRVGLVA